MPNELNLRQKYLIQKISQCKECPHANGAYAHKLKCYYICKITLKKNEFDYNSLATIPDWCPLPDAGSFKEYRR